MDAGLATVLAAAVATLGGIVIAIMQLKGFRDENRADHAVVQKRLDNLRTAVPNRGSTSKTWTPNPPKCNQSASYSRQATEASLIM